MCDQDRRIFPELVVLAFSQGDGHMFTSYEQISTPQIFKIIPAKEGCKTNRNQSCCLELAEAAAAKLAYHFLDLICCDGHFPAFGARSKYSSACISDIFLQIKTVHLNMYADDGELYTYDTGPVSLERRISREVSSANAWYN